MSKLASEQINNDCSIGVSRSFAKRYWPENSRDPLTPLLSGSTTYACAVSIISIIFPLCMYLCMCLIPGDVKFIVMMSTNHNDSNHHTASKMQQRQEKKPLSLTVKLLIKTQQDVISISLSFNCNCKIAYNFVHICTA